MTIKTTKRVVDQGLRVRSHICRRLTDRCPSKMGRKTQVETAKMVDSHQMRYCTINTVVLLQLGQTHL